MDFVGHFARKGFHQRCVLKEQNFYKPSHCEHTTGRGGEDLAKAFLQFLRTSVLVLLGFSQKSLSVEALKKKKQKNARDCLLPQGGIGTMETVWLSSYVW